ncbi:hypothetical protein SAMN05192574_102404 [Mucilaginibacter gossypiicola]|uniref:Beta/Gamma crystallin n=1 Tax=Mucilaginibacter gossypiicola TaxID=551995 RepID=A0A1H8DMQ2_9SPHI|nr:hypothetical protein [Mucilaginibacter gossypiicola]SEN08456.1 hypothetical protein SAMN05192574_102404 [Mucilaginibacter gossypiicola]
MKNFKQIAFGLMVGALALGFSAFTSASKVPTGPKFFVPKGAKLSITANFLNQPTLDSFAQLASTPNFSDCKGTSDRLCVYDVTADGKANIPNQGSYTKSEIDTYLANDWIEPDASASNAQYHP